MTRRRLGKTNGERVVVACIATTGIEHSVYQPDCFVPVAMHMIEE